MAKPNLTWLYNNSLNDGANSGNASGGAGASSSNWIVIDRVNDVLFWASSENEDGEDRANPKMSVIVLPSASVEAPKTFMDDFSEDILDQVPLAGTAAGGQSGGATRCVFAIYFDGPTAGVPYLEAWDSNEFLTAINAYLGDGTPADSTLRAIATTNAAPGSATWAGTPLSGEDSRIELDTGALAGAQNVYWNAKLVLPAAFAPLTVSDLVLACRYLYS